MTINIVVNAHVIVATQVEHRIIKVFESEIKATEKEIRDTTLEVSKQALATIKPW
jgi:hypothetical protein